MMTFVWNLQQCVVYLFNELRYPRQLNLIYLICDLSYLILLCEEGIDLKKLPNC